MRRSALWLLAGVAAALAGAAPAGAQLRIGIDSAVNPQANATPPGGTTRRVTLGEPVLFNERFSTDSGGQTQILFLDQSAMTIAPNTDVTIDEFAYNPNAGTGRLAMDTTRGLLRFVGGKLSKQAGAVSLKTPRATLAVRGGAFIADMAPSGRLDVYFIYGVAVSVTGTNGVTQELRRPGFAITVAGPGASPSAPYRAPIGALTRLLAALDGRPGGTGGAVLPPSEAAIASSGVSTVISSNVAASVQAASAAQPPASPPSQNSVTPSQNNSQTNTAEAQGNPAIGLLEGNPTVAQPGQPTGSYPLAAFAAIDTATVFNQGSAHFAAEPATAVLQAGVLTASATNIAVSVPLVPGLSTFGPQGTSSTFGAVTGTGYLAPDDAFFYVVGTAANEPGKLGVIVGGFPTVTLPTTGIGSYSGSMTGLVDNDGSIYQASGSFTNVYNFGSNSGTFNINNFDGKSLSGSVSSIGNQYNTAATAYGVSIPANVGNLVYTGNVSGSGLSGAVGGAFFGTNANDTGGGFGFQSPTGSYKAGGLFGGHR